MEQSEQDEELNKKRVSSFREHHLIKSCLSQEQLRDQRKNMVLLIKRERDRALKRLEDTQKELEMSRHSLIDRIKRSSVTHRKKAARVKVRHLTKVFSDKLAGEESKVRVDNQRLKQLCQIESCMIEKLNHTQIMREKADSKLQSSIHEKPSNYDLYKLKARELRGKKAGYQRGSVGVVLII